MLQAILFLSIDQQEWMIGPSPQTSLLVSDLLDRAMQIKLLLDCERALIDSMPANPILRRRAELHPNQYWKAAFRKLDQLDSAVELVDLATPPGRHLEAFSGNRRQQYSIRINNQYRI